MSRQKLLALWSRNKKWIWQDVLVVFALSRFVLLVVGRFAEYFPAYPYYPDKAVPVRGWYLSPHRLLDIWGRWDTGWYLSIVKHGYSVRGDLSSVQSNIAFFPLYPLVVKFFTFFLPPSLRTDGNILLIGVLLSNIFLIGALVLLYKLVLTMFDVAAARRTVLYVLLFPTSFFLSSFYAEPLFLLLTVAVFYAAVKKQWALASIAGMLAALTRGYGVMTIVPVAIFYLEANHWDLRRTRWDALWMLLIPAGLLLFLVGVYPVTGDIMAPIKNQAAWHRHFAMPWQSFLHPTHWNREVTQLGQVLTLGFLIMGVLAFFKLPSLSYGTYAFLITTPSLLGGSLLSIGRHYAVVFPIFIVAAWLGKYKTVDKWIVFTTLALQTLLFAAWSQFYVII